MYKLLKSIPNMFVVKLVFCKKIVLNNHTVIEKRSDEQRYNDTEIMKRLVLRLTNPRTFNALFRLSLCDVLRRE